MGNMLQPINCYFTMFSGNATVDFWCLFPVEIYNYNSFAQAIINCVYGGYGSNIQVGIEPYEKKVNIIGGPVSSWITLVTLTDTLTDGKFHHYAFQFDCCQR